MIVTRRIFVWLLQVIKILALGREESIGNDTVLGQQKFQIYVSRVDGTVAIAFRP